MSAEGTDGRQRRWRPSQKQLVIGTAVLVAAALAVGVTVRQVNTPNVPASLAKQIERPDQVAANAPAVAAPEQATLSETVDVTGMFTKDFAGDIADARSRVQGTVQVAPSVVTDDCLAGWVSGHLAEFAPKGAYEVVTVCGRPTAVLAGPAGADAKVLVYGALEKSAPAGMKTLIGESTSNRVAFVAVRSADPKPGDQAQLMAMSLLPTDQTAAKSTNADSSGTTYISEETAGKDSSTTETEH